MTNRCIVVLLLGCLAPGSAHRSAVYQDEGLAGTAELGILRGRPSPMETVIKWSTIVPQRGNAPVAAGEALVPSVGEVPAGLARGAGVHIDDGASAGTPAARSLRVTAAGTLTWVRPPTSRRASVGKSVATSGPTA